MAYFSRCIKGRMLLGMNKMLFAASPISLESKRIGAPAVRREVNKQHGLKNATCSSSRYEQNVRHASILGAILGDLSRILPRVSPRVLTLNQLDAPMLGVLGGVSGLHMLDGPNRASAKIARESSSTLQQDQSIERADISTHTTDNALSFRV